MIRENNFPAFLYFGNKINILFNSREVFFHLKRAYITWDFFNLAWNFMQISCDLKNAFFTHNDH